MRKHYFGRQFKRDHNERKALFKGLINELVMHEHIKTTEEKAKAIRAEAEKIITKAKRRGDLAKQFLQPVLAANSLEKVLHDLAPRFADRPGGYTRIIKTGTRVNDNASMAIIEWVEKAIIPEIIAPANLTKETKKSKEQNETKEVEEKVKTTKKETAKKKGEAKS